VAKRKLVQLLVAAIPVAAVALAAAAASAADIPKPTITANPPKLSSSKTGTFQFQSADDKLTFECSVDGEKAKACSSPYTTAELVDGSHTFSVVATDGKDKSAPATYDWTIDTTAPTTSISSGPPSLSNSRSAEFAFSSDESGASFECALDGAAFASCTPPQHYSGLADGTHMFGVRATDLAGNTGAPATYPWTIDAPAPTTTIDSGPLVVSNSPSATFAFSSTESGATFQCALDGAAFASCASPQAYSGLADGTHAFQVEASDATGKTGAPASYSWTIATVVPDTTPPAAVGVLRTRVTYGNTVLLWQLPADVDFDHVTVSRATGAGTEWVLVYTGTGTSYDDKAANNGVDHRYSVVTYDHAGNASPAAFASVPASSLLISPKRGTRISISTKRGARVSSHPVLAWAQIHGAGFYNVQLFRGGHKILSTWPKRNRLSLPSSWRYEKHGYTLSRGDYHWYVWPAIGGHYGSLEGQSSFRVS
jgi:hypothetical protein